MYIILSYSVAMLMLREVMFTVTEGDPGYDTSVLVIVDIVDGQPDIVINYTVSSTATSMYKSTPLIILYVA